MTQLEKDIPFFAWPAWETWVDIVGEYNDPNCSCRLCIAFRAWIQQAAERTEGEILDLQAALKALDETDPRGIDLNDDLIIPRARLRRLLRCTLPKGGPRS